jgi:hypothetical protein
MTVFRYSREGAEAELIATNVVSSMIVDQVGRHDKQYLPDRTAH